MYFMPLYIYGTEWPGGTKILTCSAADAAALVDGWDVGAQLVIRVGRYHRDGSDGTVAGTVVAINAVGER